MNRPLLSSLVSTKDLGRAVKSIKSKDIRSLIDVYVDVEPLGLILRPIICRLLFDNNNNSVSISDLKRFRPCRSQKDLSVGLIDSLIDFNLSEVWEDIISWSRSRKPSGREASMAGFGIDLASTVRCFYSSLLSPSFMDRLFEDVANHPLLVTLLLTVTDKFTKILSYEQIICALHKLPYSQFFIEALIIGKSQLTRPAIKSIILSKKMDSATMFSYLNGIVKIYSSANEFIQSCCLKYRIHLWINISFLCDMEHADFLDTIHTELFYRKDILAWLMTQFTSRLLLNETVILKLRKKIMSIVELLISIYGDPDEATNPSAEDYRFGCATLFVICVMKTSLNMKFPLDESSRMMTLFECILKNDLNEGSIQFFMMAISMAVCYGDFSSGNAKNETSMLCRLTRWLSGLISRCTGDGEDLAAQTELARLKEYLLICGIHFIYEEKDEIEEVIRTTIEYRPMRIKSLTTHRLKQVFTQSIYKSTSLSELAISVSPTRNLNSKMNEMVPLHGVLHLLKGRQFTAHGIQNVATWIFNQICQCSLPLHPHVPTVIKALIRANIPKTKKDFANLQSPISADLIVETCLDPSVPILGKTLLAYYLTFLAVALSRRADFLYRNYQTAGKFNVKFPAAALRRIPLKRFLAFAERTPSLASSVYPRFLSSISVVAPELLIFDKPDKGLPSEIERYSGDELETLSTKYSKQLRKLDYKRLRGTMTKLENLGDDDLETFWLMTRPLANLPEDSKNLPRWFMLSMRKLWFRLQRHIPRQLWVETLQDLAKSSDDKYSFDDYIENPTLAFQCINMVIRNPILVEIFLGCLRGFVNTQKTFYQQTLITDFRLRGSQERSHVELMESKRVKTNILLTTKVAVLQVLIEMTLPSSEDDRSVTGELRLREIQCEICFFIHQLFIDDHVFHGQPVLCKLLHFQGYSPDAISCLVHGVPSMHICVSFVPELLKYTNLELRSFAIQLLSHLVYHYPIPRTFELSKIAIRVAFTLLEGLTHDELISFFTGVLPALARISHVYSPFNNYVIDLLVRLRKICLFCMSQNKNDIRLVKEYGRLDNMVEECFDDIISGHRQMNKTVEDCSL